MIPHGNGEGGRLGTLVGRETQNPLKRTPSSPNRRRPQVYGSRTGDRWGTSPDVVGPFEGAFRHVVGEVYTVGHQGADVVVPGAPTSGHHTVVGPDAVSARDPEDGVVLTLDNLGTPAPVTRTSLRPRLPGAPGPTL